MNEKEKEYMNYVLTVIKDKAEDLQNFTEDMLLKDIEVDPIKIRMELEPLHQALDSALAQFYRRYPERRVPYYYTNYRSYRVNDDE